MKPHHVPAFDHTVQVSREWLHDIVERRPELNYHQAFSILRATLQALRDRLSVDEAAQLAAQLPLLLKGAYFDSWDPQPPSREKTAQEFLAKVRDKLGPPKAEEAYDLQAAVPAVGNVIAKHVSSGEMQDVLAGLPEPIREFFQPEHALP